MNHNDIRTLKILEIIDQGDHPSQRDLANELNVSLGLVNSFIKRLANKGYFKITTISKNRVRYMITPKGVGEKSRLTYEYIKFSYQFYNAARREINNIYKRLEMEGAFRIVLYGVNNFAEIAYISCQGTRIHVDAVVDPDNARERFFNLWVQTPLILGKTAFDRVLITDLQNAGKAAFRIVSEGVKKDKIVDFSDALCGNHHLGRY